MSIMHSNSIPSRSFVTRSGATLAFSEIGLGTAAIGNLYKAHSDQSARELFDTALDQGIRYVDTAPMYGLGLSERRVGESLRCVDRSRVLVSTKAGRLLKAVSPELSSAGGKWFDVPSRKIVYDYSYDGFMRSFEFSLERLGLDSVDILYCHDIDIMTHGSAEASDQRTREFLAPDGGYRALEQLRSQGVVKAIGLGVNEWQVSERIARETDSDLFLLAGRFTLLEQEALDSFLPLCLERKMGVVIGGPYNSGILATGAVEGAYYNYDPASSDIRHRVSRIEQICSRHGVALKSAALQFPLLHPAVVSVIPGSASEQEMLDNLTAARDSIPSDLWSELKHEGLLHNQFEPVTRQVSKP